MKPEIVSQKGCGNAWLAQLPKATVESSVFTDGSGAHRGPWLAALAPLLEYPAADSAEVSTGGGGGGTGHSSNTFSSYTSGNGGSGICIVRYEV